MRDRDLAGVRVLLVDDDDDGREMVAFVLEEHGAVVLQARTANEALTAFTAEAPDLVVSDIGLPVQDGYALLEEIRAVETTGGGSVPVIALSGYERAPESKRGSGGFAAHLTKPIEVEHLIATICRLLKRPRA